MSEDKLGAWASDDLKGTIESYEGTAYYSELDDTIRFLHGIAKLILRRLRKADLDSEQTAPSIFILGTMPDNKIEKVIKVPRLNSGFSQLAGHVWFLSCEANAGNGIEAFFDNDQKLFDYIITTLKAGDMPSVFFDAKESVHMFRFYQKGLKQMNCCLEHMIDGNDVSPAKVKRIIDHVHQTRLITPEAGDENLKLWNDKNKHHPILKPEAMIQSHLVPEFCTQLLIMCS